MQDIVQQIAELTLEECGPFIARRDLSPHHRRMVESRARQILREAAETGEYPPRGDSDADAGKNEG